MSVAARPPYDVPTMACCARSGSGAVGAVDHWHEFVGEERGEVHRPLQELDFAPVLGMTRVPGVDEHGDHRTDDLTCDEAVEHDRHRTHLRVPEVAGAIHSVASRHVGDQGRTARGRRRPRGTVVPMGAELSLQPVPGDAFGVALLAELEEGPACYIEERDDGLVWAAGAAAYFAGPDAWPDIDRQILERAEGRVLDVGAGAGRLTLALQEAGHRPVALDVSPGAIEVCAARGVRDTFLGTVDDLARCAPDPFDTIVLMGSNLALLESVWRAGPMLDTLRRLGSPDVSVIGSCRDPYLTTDPDHLEYHELNRSRGRMPGQVRMRVRFARMATEWFDYLFLSPAELETLTHAAGWEIEHVTDPDPGYLAVLRPR